MTTEEVKKLAPIDRFLYWIRERMNIYKRRKAGAPKPWTTDEVMQTTFFTHPYRELDKVTVWFRENIREPLRDDPRVIFATIAFRWFNLPATGERLMAGEFDYRNPFGFLIAWDAKKVLGMLSRVRDAGEQIFTGAYMINSPAGEPKLEAIVRRIDGVWQRRSELVATKYDHPRKWHSMEELHTFLQEFDGLGGFMAYEVVCDLRYTKVLENAPDKMSWCNPGPGCIRGLYRIAGESWDSKGNNATAPPRPKDWQKRMTDLLELVRKKLSHLPPFEMREIEHSLCEFDKMERVLWGDGRAKRSYNGRA